MEKEDLVKALETARLAPPSPPPPPPAASPPSGSADRFGGFGSAVAQAEAEAAEVNSMSIEAIKAELEQYGVDVRGMDDDKTRLVSELLNARAFNRPQFDSSMFGGEAS